MYSLNKYFTDCTKQTYISNNNFYLKIKNKHSFIKYGRGIKISMLLKNIGWSVHITFYNQFH